MKNDYELDKRLKRMNFLNKLTARQKGNWYLSRIMAQLRLAKKKPRLAWNIFKFWIHYKFSDKPRMRAVDMMVTGKCNFSCIHCYASNWREQDLIPLPVLKKGIDELISLGVFHFTLQGGEPLVDIPRLKEIIKMCRPQASYISITTNGWLLTPDVIADLKECGVDKFGISLDSGLPEEHDKSRNTAQSFSRAVKALEDVRSAGLHTGISTCISHQNLHSEGMKALFRYARDKKHRINIIPACPSGKLEGQREILFTEEDSEFILN